MTGQPNASLPGIPGGMAVAPARSPAVRQHDSAFLSSRPEGSSPASHAELKLRDYLRILSYHWKLLLCTALVPLAGTVAYTLLQPKCYRAEAVLIRTDAPSATPARGEGDVALLFAVERFNRREPELIRSALAHMGRNLRSGAPLPNENELARWATARQGDASREIVVSAIMSGPRGARDDSERCELVASATNALAAALIEQLDTDIEEAKRQLQSKINSSADQLSIKLKEILTYRTGRLSLQGTEIPPLLSEVEKAVTRTDELARSRQVTEFQASELAERLKQIEASLNLQLDLSAAAGTHLPELDVKDLRTALLKTEMALANAETRYQPNHPVQQKLHRERDALRARLAERAADTEAGHSVDMGRLQIQRDVAEAELAGINARLAAIDAAMQRERVGLDKAVQRLKESGEDSTFSAMLRDRELLSATLASQQKEMERIGRDQVPGATPKLRTLREAQPPGGPYSPRWPVNLAIGMGLAMLLVLAAAFIAENMEDRIRDQRDLVQHFNLPFLGPVPLWHEGESTIINLDHPRSVIADVFGVLRNNIGYALPPGTPKTLLIASSVVGEGKSTIAANLAISYCLDGNNVILVDTDLRRPKAHRLMESLCPSAASSSGLTAFLSGRASAEDIVLQTRVPGLSIIAAGHGAINPSKLLGSQEMKTLAGNLTREFDVVILDGPAVLPVVDSTVVTSLVSGVLLVVSSKRAPVEQVGTAIVRLEHVKAPIIGMVLNRQPGGSRGYYHYYGSRYGYGYSDHESSRQTGA